MKILHCCLSAFYIDNYSYQENILPKMHKLQGHEVSIIASTETFINNSAVGYVKPGSYFSRDNILVTRISYVKWLPHFLSKKLRIYERFIKIIENFNPDIIFIHGSQFASIVEIVSYVKRYPSTKIYVDNHSDFINSGKSWLSRKLLHGIIYKWCTVKIEPFTRKFFGVLPIRVDFLTDVYGVPPNKVDLLVMGADHTVAELDKKDEIRSRIRRDLHINEADFVLVTGGKIDNKKRIDFLMKTVIDLKIPNIVLIVFGSTSQEIKETIDDMAKSKNIRYIGWLESDEVYNYYLASDLAIFPGTHSVLWEQAVGVGLPCIFRKWHGMEHLDLKGNCLFFEKEEMVSKLIVSLFEDNKRFSKMREIAEDRGLHEFSYYEIAKRAIEA